jgi:hypothetical protein
VTRALDCIVTSFTCNQLWQQRIGMDMVTPGIAISSLYEALAISSLYEALAISSLYEARAISSLCAEPARPSPFSLALATCFKGRQTKER